MFPILMFSGVMVMAAILKADVIDDYIDSHIQDYSKYNLNHNHDNINISNLSDDDFERMFSKKDHSDNFYDFIVVGSGSAGGVVASRLSENPHFRVLLIEAGKVETPLNRIPSLSQSLDFYADYGWKYFTEPQPGIAKSYKNSRMQWLRGKALGGTSVVNQQIMSRGNPLDYNLWAEKGNPGWSYEEVLPYFRKLEMCRLNDVDYRYHGRNGKISVERAITTDLVYGFIEAGGDLGYDKYIDFNSPHQYGFAKMQCSLFHGERHSVARAYLFPAFNRPNLDILIKSHVTKILIDPKTNNAYGVEYFRKKKHYGAFARKEVILSAGVIGSPQLLMLSGIGPREHLEDLSIPLIKDLPVGQTLYDHIMYPGLIFQYRGPLSFTLTEAVNAKNLAYFATKRAGPLRTNLGNAIGFIRTNLSRLDRPDIELLLGDGSIASDHGVFSIAFLKIKPSFYKKFWAPYSKLRTMSIIPVVLHPDSVGHLKLRSANPFDHPLIYANYLSDPNKSDLKTLIEGIRFAMKFSETATFKELGIRLLDTPVPGCEKYEFYSDPYWECAIGVLAYTYFHPIATAKMGPPDDPKSVVDHQLRVYGVKNLRVVDSSVIPVTLGGHLNIPTIMIGEKASDIIKHRWEKNGKK